MFSGDVVRSWVVWLLIGVATLLCLLSEDVGWCLRMFWMRLDALDASERRRTRLECFGCCLVLFGIFCMLLDVV